MLATNLATPTTRKNLQARSVRKSESIRREFMPVRILSLSRVMQSICKFDAVKFLRCAQKSHQSSRSYSNAPLVAELPEGSFLGIQCSAPRTVIFLLHAAVVRKREIGGEMGSYSNAPLVAELPEGSFLGIQCSAPRTVIFLLRAAVVRKRAQWRVKETPPLIVGVRCIGRSYRNRTYTMGVRGPCATTTPSSNARSLGRGSVSRPEHSAL